MHGATGGVRTKRPRHVRKWPQLCCSPSGELHSLLWRRNRHDLFSNSSKAHEGSARNQDLAVLAERAIPRAHPDAMGFVTGGRVHRRRSVASDQSRLAQQERRRPEDGRELASCLVPRYFKAPKDGRNAPERRDRDSSTSIATFSPMTGKWKQLIRTFRRDPDTSELFSEDDLGGHARRRVGTAWN